MKPDRYNIEKQYTEKRRGLLYYTDWFEELRNKIIRRTNKQALSKLKLENYKESEDE